MEITMRDGDLLTAGDLKLYRVGYGLYKVDDTTNPLNPNYFFIGSWDQKNDIDTLTFEYEGMKIHFPPVPRLVDEVEEESLWQS